MKKFSCFPLLCFLAAHTAPLLTAGDARMSSWYLEDSTRYARVRETKASVAEGATTWTGQTQPAYAGIHEVSEDADYVYVRTQGLASYVMGPWYLDTAKTQLFPNRPAAQGRVWRVKRNAEPASTKTLTGLGTIGLYVNGVAMFDNRDGFTWTGSGETGGQGGGYWQRDAWVNEGITFDSGLAHQEQTGNYHYHAHPPMLRLQLGDNVVRDPVTGAVSEATTGHTHSPILAWALDGFPVYGPYGYANATNPASGVRRMLSGFVLRDGRNGTDNLATTGRSTLPKWAQRAYGVGAGQSGPAVSTQYPLGRYLEDKAFLGDLVRPDTGRAYEPGVDFDLNEWNCRWTTTPEFPAGTWAYFCTIHADGSPAFPYVIGRQYFGTPATTQGTVTIPATATTSYKGGPDAPTRVEATQPTSGDVVLTWNSIEGGTYRVEAASVLGSWEPVANGIAGEGGDLRWTDTGRGTEARRFHRVALTALADYGRGGTGGTTGGIGGGAEGGMGGALLGVSPARAARGTASLLVTFSLDSNAQPPLPPAQIVPSSVMIGTVAGNGIARPSSASVTARFTFPAGAATGAQSVTVTFPGPGGGTGPSFTLPAAFTVE